MFGADFWKSITFLVELIRLISKIFGDDDDNKNGEAAIEKLNGKK